MIDLKLPPTEKASYSYGPKVAGPSNVAGDGFKNPGL